MMKRIVPVILYCGWFLMVPPTDGPKVLNKTPVSKWIHASSHDTAQECEQEKIDQYFISKKGNDPSARSFLDARCIPADSIPVK